MTERRHAPPPGPPADYRFPPVERRPLPGGGELLAVRRDDFPLVYLELLAPAGNLFEGDHPGIADFTAELLDEGTERWTSQELALETERLGAELDTGADRDLASATLTVLSEGLEGGLALLGEIFCRPTFPDEEIERLRRETLTELLRRRDRPSSLAADALNHALYGSGPYARPMVGTEESVRGFDREAIRAFYDHHYGARGLRLLAVGDFDPDDLARQATEHLAGCSAEGHDSDGWDDPPPVSRRPGDGLRVVLVDRPGAVQTELRLGQVAVPRRHPDMVPLLVLNVILGGKFTSRINLNLRERHGYTYGANSVFSARLAPGPFRVSSAVSTEAAAAAAREVLHEIDRIRAEPVSAEELEDAQGYILGVFPYLLQTGSGIAQRLETMAVHGLGYDYYDRYPDAIRRVTRDEIQRVARETLDPEALVIAAVGPAETLRAPFEELAPVTVVERDEAP